ncbi:Bromodomain transcription factor [Zea mays]|uniref:Bromodomain transcription factor n=1 Tax=Zea mays TaxID=4577 RepID=A0A1D6Q3M5_MAIZE|nr:Bromodomain transcription factor [Zea mays]
MKQQIDLRRLDGVGLGESESGFGGRGRNGGAPLRTPRTLQHSRVDAWRRVGLELRPTDAKSLDRPPHRSKSLSSQTSLSHVVPPGLPSGTVVSLVRPAALRALSDIAGRYIASLGHTAAAFAEARGRTEPNVTDAVLALEDHALGGFPGAADPTRPLLCSGALAELAQFVAAVREVPFPKPLPRRDPGCGSVDGWESFAAAGRQPPLNHVPHWLPCFPEGWEERLRVRC